MATRKLAEPSNCQTCNGHGATDIVPLTMKNTEKHYNKYGNNLKLGLGGGSHMGVSCSTCGGNGRAK